MKEQASGTLAEVTRKLRDEGERLVSEQKQRAAQGLEGVGASIREAAGRFQAGPLGVAAGTYAEAAAERVSRASEYLAERDVPDLLRDAEQAMVRRPQWFLGGMFLAGLAAARFLKATQADAEAAGARQRRSQADRPQRSRQPAR